MQKRFTEIKLAYIPFWILNGRRRLWLLRRINLIIGALSEKINFLFFAFLKDRSLGDSVFDVMVTSKTCQLCRVLLCLRIVVKNVCNFVKFWHRSLLVNLIMLLMSSFAEHIFSFKTCILYALLICIFRRLVPS